MSAAADSSCGELSEANIFDLLARHVENSSEILCHAQDDKRDRLFDAQFLVIFWRLDIGTC
jgi:hypothetical protein